MITTKGQRKRLYDSNIGYGWIVMKSGGNEIAEIEVYVGKDKVLRRVGNGQPLLPIHVWDEERNEIIEVSNQ